MASLMIQGGRVISPEDRLDDELDVLIDGDVIQAIAPRLSSHANEILDARGLIVSPGFVDLHAHLREPGGEISETLATGLAAAVAGGFTAVCPMPNTCPVNDRPESTRFLVEKANQFGLARVFPIAAVSVGCEGQKLADFSELVAAGAVGFSDDGRPVKTADLMQRALEEARRLGVPVIDHCEDLSLSADGVIHEGAVSERLGLRGIPGSSEDACVERDLTLAEATGGRLHVAHLSTAGAIEMVRAAKRRGVRVTCEVTPHHFTLTDQAVVQYGTHAKMRPPLRSARDREAVVEGISNGTVDAIATDHAPHAPELKNKSLTDAPFGVLGFETALALALKQLVRPGKISLPHLIVLMSANPARIIGKPLGRLQVGGPADVTLFDPSLEWTYRAAQGRSKSHNSPFDTWEFKGAVIVTIVAGRIVHRRSGIPA